MNVGSCRLPDLFGVFFLLAITIPLSGLGALVWTTVFKEWKK